MRPLWEARRGTRLSGWCCPRSPKPGSFDPGLLRATVAHAEAAGIDALWACDHLFWHGPVVEAFTALATAAATTTRCALGTAVLQLALRRPAVVAKTAASLQLLSGGRFVLGVGAGVHEGEFAAAGVDFASRGRQVDAALDELERLWAPADDRYQQLPALLPRPGVDRRVERPGPPPGGAARRRLDPHVPVAPGAARPLRPARRRGRPRRPPPCRRDPRGACCSCTSTAGPRPPAAAAWHGCRRCTASPRTASGATSWRAHLTQCVDRIGAYVEAGAQHLCLFVADDDPVPHLDAILGGLRSAAPAPPPGNGHAIEPVRAGDPPTRTVHP